MLDRSRLAAMACLFGALTSCAPETAEPATTVIGSGPTEPFGAGVASDAVFGLDSNREGVVVVGSGVPVGDGGLAWCTTPSPEHLRTSIPLSSAATIQVFGGGCVPSDGYYRACNDAGLPIYVPTCDAANTGKRLEIVTGGHTVVSLRADSIDVVPGPLAGETWSVGPSERAVLATAPRKLGANVRETTRVVAVAFKADDWQDPSEEFADVVPYAKTGTFTFWRRAVCVESLGCTMARWEASRSGVRVSVAEKELYAEAKSRIVSQMTTLRSQSPGCPAPAILAAARIYALSRISGDEEKAALKEFDGLVSGLSTRRCAGSEFGHQKPLGAIRHDLAAGVRKLLAPGGRAR